MIGYYAVGGGLGHLTRGRRVVEALGLDATLITASAYATDVRVTGGFPVVQIPAQIERTAHREWLRELGLSRLIVDTFPCGIQGELSGLDVPMDLVARRVRWEAYRKAVPTALPRFENMWLVEELEPEQERALWSAATASRRFRFPPDEQRQLAVAALHTDWLIVHSGPVDEVRELVAYAQELMRMHGTPERVLVATRCSFELPPHFERIDAYPVSHLFARAGKIISAAGFNVMLETEPWRDKHHVLPFARTFDDQFARAAARKRFASPVVTT